MADNQEQLYNEFADLAQLEKQRDRVLAIFGDIKKGIKDLNDAGITIDKSTGLGGLSDGLKKQKKAQDELAISVDAYNKILTENAKLEARIAAAQSEAGKKLAENRLQQQELNKANKEAAKDAAGLTDAYTKLAKQYEQASRNAQNLIITKGKDNEETKEAIAVAQKLGNQLKDTDAQVGKFQRNVGNYANSLSGGFELVRREIARLQREQQSFTLGGDTRGAEAAQRRISELDNIIKVSFDDTKNFDQVVKSLQKSFSTMAANGSQSNEFLQDFKKFTAEAKDQAEDLKQEIKALSSDTRKLDLAAGSVNFLADSFQLAAGAAQLAGASEEQTAAAVAKLVAVQSVANGLKGVANELTTKGTAANAVYATVQNLVATTTDRSAAATLRLSAATKLLLGGLIIGGLALLVIKLSELSNRTSEAAKQQKILSDINKEVAKSVGQEISQLEVLYRVATNTNLSIKERKKAVDQLQEQYPQHFKNINDEIILQGKAADAYENTKKSILENARVRAVESKLAALATKELEIVYEREDDLRRKNDAERKDSLNRQKDAINQAKGIPSTIKPDEFISGKLAVDAINEKLKASNNELSVIAKEREFLFTLINKAPEKTGDGNASATTKNNTNDIADRNSRAKLESLKLDLENAANIQRQIVEIESFSFAERTEALQKYISLKQQIIEADAKYELNKAGLTASERALIEKKKLDDQFKAGEEALKLLKQTAGSAADEIVEELEPISQEVIDITNEISDGIGEEAVKKIAESYKKAAKEIKTIWSEELGEFLEYAQIIADTAGNVIGGIFDGQKNRIQEQIDDIERLKAAEIDRINKSGENEEKKAARIAIIEAKAQADRETLERRQRAIDRQRAIAERAFKVFQITTDTIQAVNKIKLLIAAAPDPITKALYGSQLGLAIASGAGSLVSLLATPIPKFFKGKKASDSYEGPGIVGDQGRELGISKTGKLTLYEKPTLTHLMKGDVILPNRVTEDLLRSVSFTTPSLNTTNNNAVQIDYTGLFEKQNEILKKIEKKQGITVVNNIDLSPYYYNQLKN